MRPSSATPWLLLGGLLLATAGCGRHDSPLAPVHGRVFFRGTPLAGGSIVFVPNTEKGNQGSLGRADILPDGSYALQTNDKSGAVPGWHRVSVIAVDAPREPLPRDGFVTVRLLTPPRYAAPELSGLEGLVEPGKDNTLDFHLD
jgi:hypothetical protein